MKFSGSVFFCWIFIFAGLVLFGLGGYFYFLPAPLSVVEITDSNIEIADISAGQTKEVVLRLQNHSNHSLRILGLVPC